MMLKFFHSLSPELQQTILSFLGGVADAIECFKSDGPFSRLQYLCWGFPDKQNPTILGIFGLRGQPWWDHDADDYSRHAFSSSAAEETGGGVGCSGKKHGKPIISYEMYAIFWSPILKSYQKSSSISGIVMLLLLLVLPSTRNALRPARTAKATGRPSI